jgi:paraquat-inducible protein B
MKKYTKTKKNGGGLNYDNLVNLMSKIKNDVVSLGEIVKRLNSNTNTKTEENVSNEIPINIQEKIEEQTKELNNVIEKMDEQEKKIDEEPVKTELSTSDVEMDESKEELEKNINLLEEKIKEGLPQERNRSFYLQGRTWNQWFYGFVEYYNEIKDNLTNIIENNYYISILQKPKNERSKTENNMISKVNDIEIELSKMNNNVIKGGYFRKTRNKRSKK